MNCEKAENYLSAYLDDMLDPQLHTEVAAHLDGCAQCSEVVTEYRRYDTLLANTPRVSPSAALHDRIFNSPEFAAILRQQARANEAHPSAPQPAERRSANRGSPPHWGRIALQTAAVFVILVGSALLLKQGLFHSGPSTARHGSTPVIGNPNPNDAPLAAGNRVVYEHDGALWSAPESGPGLAQRLTPSNVQVSSVWSVSPDGKYVVYAEAGSGRLHVIRADRQGDTPLSSASALCSGAGICSVHPALVWSPDGTRIAYQAADGTLHVVNADGTNDQAITTSTQGLAISPLWSQDSLRLAYIQVNNAEQSVWSYDLVNRRASQLAAHADPANLAAVVEQMFWLPDAQHPALTWATWDATSKTITGIFTRDLLQSNTVRLTPADAHVTAAGFTPKQGTGLWLVGITQNETPALATVSATQPGLTITNSAPGNAITGIYWSPTGNTAAIVSEDGELSLATQNGASLASSKLNGVTGVPAWSPDGTHLAAQISVGIVSMRISNGQPASITHLLLGEPLLANMTMLWASDSQSIAITAASGTYLSSPDNGHTFKQVDTQTAAGPFGWSVAG